MTSVTILSEWSDDRDNAISFPGHQESGIQIHFTGSNNRLVVAEGARIGTLAVHFNCDNGYMEIGPSSGVPALSMNVRIGQDAKIVIGANVSCTAKVGMSAVEGAAIHVGDDVMFASENQLRCDDGHPIFDVRSGKRINVARDISIGAHVWVGWGAVVLGGTTVGAGTVLGMGSIVKGTFPNNCVVAGTPARVLRRDVAWERPHLSLVKPFYKPDASTIKKSKYWALTVDPTYRQPLLTRARRLAGRLRRRLRRGLRTS